MRTPFLGVTNELRTRSFLCGPIWAAALIATCLFPMLTLGQTNSAWNGGTGNWSNATDWNPNQVPNNGGGNTYNVTIDSLNGDVTLDISPTINSLVLGSNAGGVLLECTTVSGTPQTLNITGNLAVNPSGGVAFGNGSAISVGGNVTITGVLQDAFALQLQGGATMSVLGDLTNSARNIAIDTGSALTISGNLTNSGFFETYGVGSSPPNTLNVTGTLTNDLGGTVYIGDPSFVNSAADVASVGALVNNGILAIGTGATLKLTNQPNGITDVLQGSTINLFGSITAGSNNGLANLASIEGTLSLGNGEALTLAQLASIQGTLTLENGEALTLTSSTLAVSATGSLALQDDSSLVVSGNLTNSGKVSNAATNSGSTLTVTGTLTNNAGAVLGYLFGRPGAINIGTLVNNGILEIGPGGTLSITTGSTLTNNGTITITSLPAAEMIIDPVSVTLSGKGKLNLQGGLITASALNNVLINDSTIQGWGNIGDGSMGLVNKGVISANQKFTELIIDPSSAGFNNQGTLEVESQGSSFGRGAALNITGSPNSFLNFNAGTDTLTGGTYIVNDGTLEFDNANIVTNEAKITLAGVSSRIIDQTGANGLANFAVNGSAGSFTLSGKRNLTTAGSFSNAGKLIISAGSTFTAGGTDSYAQTAGTTTVSGNLVVASPGGVGVSGGSVFGIGTITGNIDLTGGLLSPGAVSKKAGELTVSGTYTQSGPGAFDVDLGGTKAATQYDVLNITGTASLGGTLNVDLISGFKPTVGESFDIMDYSSETGMFSTTNLPKVTGDHWTVTYNATDVVLTLVAGPGPAAQGVVSASPAKRVSRGLVAGISASMHEPTAILSGAACFAARLLRTTWCGEESVALAANSGEKNAATFAGSGSGTVHNNLMVATRSISAARGGASQETSDSAKAMATLYVCAYFPSNVAHTLGCN